MFEIKKDFASANIPTTVRFTEELHEELKQLAQKHDISFNRLVLMCCQYALDNMKPEEE